MFSRIIFLIVVLASANVWAAIPNCPAKLIPPPELVVGDLVISGSFVSWQGKPVPYFRPGLRYSEIALLYFLATHPNQIFNLEQIIQSVFPYRANDPHQKQESFFKSVLFKLRSALEDVDSQFKQIKTVRLHGWSWVDLNSAAPMVLRVGDVRVTANEVFWQGSPVPDFRSSAHEKRRLLMTLLKHVDQCVDHEELATEIWLKAHSLTLAEQAEQIHALVTEIYGNFQSVDSRFSVLKTRGSNCVAWSPSGKIQQKLITLSPVEVPPKRYRFRGKELKLNESTRLILESLIEQAPMVVSKSELWAAAMNGRPSVRTSLLRVRMLQLRAETGADTIRPVRGVGYAWVARDKPEIIEEEQTN